MQFLFMAISPKPVSVFDQRPCMLGEGPLWHPLRQQLFWFDIVNSRMLSRSGERPLEWQFDRMVSAAGWVDIDTLLIAGETGLSSFDIPTGQESLICEIEADNVMTRSNDGRADPWGGFWMGTMSKSGDTCAGTLYRWKSSEEGDELRVLETEMTTPNAICFDRSRNCAYYSDTRTRIIWRRECDPQSGWPIGQKEVFVDLRASEAAPEHKPDGAVIDSEGCLWNAQWGSARISRYSPDGAFLEAIPIPTGHTSCPAFGGAQMSTLFVTSALQKLPESHPQWHEMGGMTFSVQLESGGIEEPPVKL